MTDHDVRDFLDRMAAEEPLPALDAEPLIARARRRATRTVVVGALGVAALIALLFTGASQLRGAPTDPMNNPSPTVTLRPPPPGPFAEWFDSPTNGISIGYPAGWKTRTATEPWDGGRIAFDAPDVDVIFNPELRHDLYIAVVSEPLSGTSPREWVDDHYDRPSMGVCYSGGAGGIGNGFQGNPAWFQDCHDPTTDRPDGHIAIFATATRGYVIYLHIADEERLQATYSGDWFWGVEGDGHGTGLLDTVDLQLGGPVDSAHASGSS